MPRTCRQREVGAEGSEMSSSSNPSMAATSSQTRRTLTTRTLPIPWTPGWIPAELLPGNPASSPVGIPAGIPTDIPAGCPLGVPDGTLDGILLGIRPGIPAGRRTASFGVVTKIASNARAFASSRSSSS